MKRLSGAERLKFARDVVSLRTDGVRGWKAIADGLGARGWDSGLLTEGRIKAAIRDYPRLRMKWHGATKTDRPISIMGVREYTFAALDDEPCEEVRLPVFDGEPHLTGDWVIAGDFHLPTTDFGLADVLLNTARELGMKRLLIVGDLCNFEAFSRYEYLVPPPTFEVEVKVAVHLMARYAEHFDEIVMVLGNHEHRLMKRTGGSLSATLLGHILCAAQNKMRVSPYGHAIIESEGQVWRATHQRGYSRIKGRVGDQLAQKYQCNILAFHEHHVAVQRDTFNRYAVLNCGGLHDEKKMAYATLSDSTMPGMARGFVLLVNGCAHLVTPYPTMTDLPVLVAGLKTAFRRGE